MSVIKKIYYKHPDHGKIIRFIMSNGDDFIDLNKPKDYGGTRTVRVHKKYKNLGCSVLSRGCDILKESKTLYCKVFKPKT